MPQRQSDLQKTLQGDRQSLSMQYQGSHSGCRSMDSIPSDGQQIMGRDIMIEDHIGKGEKSGEIETNNRLTHERFSDKK
ncbi:unnamed protein product, partial [Mesorhabditis belari]|uniref:Uncharacterized protein n=2 Tax=Mesorhabditis belari TaxID=2138241 RepID=A0AAF3JAU8_9BILA